MYIFNKGWGGVESEVEGEDKVEVEGESRGRGGVEGLKIGFDMSLILTFLFLWGRCIYSANIVIKQMKIQINLNIFLYL